MTKYKVNNLRGIDEESGHSYKFSHVGTNKWDCQSMWASAVKQGNTETRILTSENNQPFAEDEAAMAYARKRFNLNTVGYNQEYHDMLKAASSTFADFAKIVKKGEYDATRHESLLQSINELYDFVNTQAPEEEKELVQNQS
jgi:hypothetical protein